MAYIGAEAGSNEALRRLHKGTRVEHTLEVAARLRENGVTPEFSFVLGGPDDPESDVEATLAFVRRLKHVHPTCEVILYFHSPTPQRDPRTMAGRRRGGRQCLRAMGPTVRPADDSGRMDRAAVGPLRVSPGCAMVVAASAAAGEGFRARARMPVSNSAGLPHAPLAKDDVAGARPLALGDQSLRAATRARGGETPHRVAATANRRTVSVLTTTIEGWRDRASSRVTDRIESRCRSSRSRCTARVTAVA